MQQKELIAVQVYHPEFLVQCMPPLLVDLLRRLLERLRCPPPVKCRTLLLHQKDPTDLLRGIVEPIWSEDSISGATICTYSTKDDFYLHLLGKLQSVRRTQK